MIEKIGEKEFSNCIILIMKFNVCLEIREDLDDYNSNVKFSSV